MGPTLHSQIAALPLVVSPMNAGKYLQGGRLFCHMDSRDPLWLADLSESADQPDSIPIRWQRTPPPQLAQHYFISADQRNFHQLCVTSDRGRPRVDKVGAILTATPRLPAMVVHWQEGHIHLVYAASDRMTLSLKLTRTAVGNTLLNGAFYAFTGENSPVPQNLTNFWDTLT